MFEITDFQKIGVGLAGFGVAFLFLGVLLLFDKGLLALGNPNGCYGFNVDMCHMRHAKTEILFLTGLAFVIGLERTFRFFFQRHKIRGTLAFFGGIFIVIFGFPLIGIIVETYGFVLLFSGFFPVVINFLRRIPILGSLLNLPFIGPETRAGRLCELLCRAPWWLLSVLGYAADALLWAASKAAAVARDARDAVAARAAEARDATAAQARRTADAATGAARQARDVVADGTARGAAAASGAVGVVGAGAFQVVTTVRSGASAGAATAVQAVRSATSAAAEAAAAARSTAAAGAEEAARAARSAVGAGAERVAQAARSAAGTGAEKAAQAAQAARSTLAIGAVEAAQAVRSAAGAGVAGASEAAKNAAFSGAATAVRAVQSAAETGAVRAAQVAEAIRVRRADGQPNDVEAGRRNESPSRNRQRSSKSPKSSAGSNRRKEPPKR